SNIVVLGGLRFVVSGLVDESLPYHVATVQTFDDDPGTLPETDRTDRLREEFASYAALVRELSDVEPEDPDLPEEALPLSFHVSAGIDIDAAIKQRLLVERSTRRRVDALLMVLPSLRTTVERALVVHRRAHTNGRGHGRPNLPAE